MPDVLKGKNVDVKIWAKLHEVESSALDQLRNIASLPWVFHHVAVMPDVHYGKGATVGSVIAMKNAVSPAAVGVDIGCGMSAVKTNLTLSDLPNSLKRIRLDIEAAIPVGFNRHKGQAPPKVNGYDIWDEFKGLSPKVQDKLETAFYQCGTLGGGNHFIEFCVDTEDNMWMMLHSGSRNIGMTLASVHIKVAKELEHNIGIVDRDLAVFLSGTPEMAAYRRDLFWAQRYAKYNRSTMVEIYKNILKKHFSWIKFGKEISCHHNYVAEETHFGEDVLITRKGAIRAEMGDLGIIPGSMGASSFIVEGLGNAEAFNSASHGAGRKMSRGKAKRTFTEEDVRAQTMGIECKKDESVIDEIPGAYKSIDEVMANQKDLVKIKHKLRQLLCVKG